VTTELASLSTRGCVSSQPKLGHIGLIKKASSLYTILNMTDQNIQIIYSETNLCEKFTAVQFDFLFTKV